MPWLLWNTTCTPAGLYEVLQVPFISIEARKSAKSGTVRQRGRDGKLRKCLLENVCSGEAVDCRKLSKYVLCRQIVSSGVWQTTCRGPMS
jgi:hypothetical protein